MAFENTKGLIQTTIKPFLKDNWQMFVAIFIYYALFINYGLSKYGFERSMLALTIIFMINIGNKIQAHTTAMKKEADEIKWHIDNLGVPIDNPKI